MLFSRSLWLVASILFSFYIDNFANYNATYGALGALIGMTVWVWISVIILIVGAELNAEFGRQTARETTTVRAKPMGKRGAFVADTLGEAVDRQQSTKTRTNYFDVTEQKAVASVIYVKMKGISELRVSALR